MKARFIIETKNGHDDSSISVYVKNFKVMPIGTAVYLYNKKGWEILGGEKITGYDYGNTDFLNVYFEGRKKHQIDQFLDVCKVDGNWTTHSYPKTLSMKTRRRKP